ncbi:MAG TPA: hypothetical protein VEY30_11880 [Myxococcaceae bacterium]|nr:hypothetical protein [Myxococcaceae bacterium]
MKRILAVVAIAWGVTGCSSPESSVRILNGYALQSGEAAGGACERQEIAQYRGSLDISANSSYLLAFGTESDFQSVNTTVGTDTIADGSRNNFIGDQIVFSYMSEPSLPFEEERTNIHFVIEPGANGDDSFVILDLLGPKAAELLRNNVSVGNSAELQISFYVKGKTAAGGDVETNTVAYPITIRNTGFAGCPGGDFVLNGPCGGFGGQDGIPAGCCTEARFKGTDFCPEAETP